MNSLEFIEKEINHLEMILSCMVGITAKKELTSKLQQLEQIKTKLEAWENIKLYFIEKHDGYSLRIYDEDNGIYDKVKKALEIENEKES